MIRWDRGRHRCEPECYLCVVIRGGSRAEVNLALSAHGRYVSMRAAAVRRGAQLRQIAEAYRQADERMENGSDDVMST
jgi:hypothetical protein